MRRCIFGTLRRDNRVEVNALLIDGLHRHCFVGKAHKGAVSPGQRTLVLGALMALLAVVLVAVGTQGAAAEGVVFMGEGIRLTAFFTDDAVHIVFSDGREAVLEQRVSASGARYTDGETLIWNKGDEARLEWLGETYNVAIATAANDVWTRAKEAGVDFRAVGQEPGWYVDIRNGESLHVVLDYGATVITVPLSEYRDDYVHGVRTYITEPPLAPLQVTVRVASQVCYDTMSGEGFTSMVTVGLPDTGKAYTGCGRDL